jgi:GMP synthase-like glutamine amidotransferase
MQIGILQTGHAPDALLGHMGDYPSMFERLLQDQGLSFRTWAVVDGEFPESIHDADGWLLTGSRHGAYDRHLPFIPRWRSSSARPMRRHVPMVGVCFGHQIIAQAMGGLVEKFRTAGPSVRRTMTWAARRCG